MLLRRFTASHSHVKKEGNSLTGLEDSIAHHRPGRRQWRAWAATEPALAIGYQRFRHQLRNSDQHRRDDLLAALVRTAQRDRDAVSVVVVCLWPGLRALVATYAPGLDGADALAIAVTGLCQSIADHPPDGPAFVASRLLRRPKWHLQRAVRAELTRRKRLVSLPFDLDVKGPGVELPAASCLALGVDAGVISVQDAWLIHATHGVGHSVDWAARQLGVSYEAAKKRRQRAAGRWAAWWMPEDELASRVSSTDPQEVIA